MSNRHYLKIINKKDGRVVYVEQILGNNDYFDDEVYERLGLALNENGCSYDTEVDLVSLIFEWRKWLDRNERITGTSIPKYIFERFDDELEQKREVYFDTYLGFYFSLQPFMLLHNLRPYLENRVCKDDVGIMMIGKLKKEYKAVLEVF